jgi:hypothetical protein
MAIKKTEGGPQGMSSTTDMSGAPAASATETATEPHKKHKKKYGRFRKTPIETEESIAKGVHRVARAVEQGLSAWRSNTKKSSRSKRDGAIRDVVKNVGKATSKFGREAAKVPGDIAKSLPNFRRTFR